MYYEIGLDNNSLELVRKTKAERNKGKNLFCFPDEYIVIDTETTGLDTICDSIIEISAIKINHGVAKEEFSTLIRPDEVFFDENDQEMYVDEFITELTGITNDMLASSPKLDSELPKFLDFVGNDILLGHNINFDINFIYDEVKTRYNKDFSNDFCDLLRISRKLFPDFDNHKLKTLAKNFSINQEISHRGLADCITTYKCFEYCREYAITNNINVEELLKYHNFDFRKLTPETTTFDESNPLYGKTCVFTGTLDVLTRKEAGQIVVNMGGNCGNGVTQQTNYLILGDTYHHKLNDGKSAKLKKAEDLILKGADLQILSENAFYDIIFE